MSLCDWSSDVCSSDLRGRRLVHDDHPRVEQQIVEIAKALSLDARVIVMDEPTAALSAIEVERLFGVVATLRAAGAEIGRASCRERGCVTLVCGARAEK